MENYVAPLVIVCILNLAIFGLNYLYYDLVVTLENSQNEQEKKTGYAIKVLTDGFGFIALGSLLLFGALPLIGNILGDLAKKVGLDKAISLEEAFLINFCVLFGFLGIIILNRILPVTYKSIRDGFNQTKKVKNGSKE